MHLNAVLKNAHAAAWRLPENDPHANMDVDYWNSAIKIAEAAKLDAVFIADISGLDGGARHGPGDSVTLDPLVLLSALAAHTRSIGLIATTSTSWNEPFNVARRFASLDHISGGRAGWNAVVSGNAREAVNFNLDELAPHRERYERAEEFVAVVKALWDSWADDAATGDQGTGVYLDCDRVVPIRHRGHFFAVEGPLNVPRSPQGHPVVVQAGSSDTGRDFAARHADVVFTAQAAIEGAQAFYADIKGRAAAAGRRPEEVLILPGVMPIVAETRDAAARRWQTLDDSVVLDHGLANLSHLLDVDVRDLRLDAELPAGVEEHVGEAYRSSAVRLIALARADGLTVEGLLRRVEWGHGHRTLIGTAQDVADDLELWIDQRAADGFNLMLPSLLHDLSAFAEHVVPELQRRGRFRHDYSGATLREHYGLPRPPAAWAAPASADVITN
jgi:FMN-dependent oxidoreductase (nitrilotriacetate monooxygenase family)